MFRKFLPAGPRKVRRVGSSNVLALILHHVTRPLEAGVCFCILLWGVFSDFVSLFQYLDSFACQWLALSQVASSQIRFNVKTFRSIGSGTKARIHQETSMHRGKYFKEKIVSKEVDFARVHHVPRRVGHRNDSMGLKATRRMSNAQTSSA